MDGEQVSQYTLTKNKLRYHRKKINVTNKTMQHLENKNTNLYDWE